MNKNIVLLIAHTGYQAMEYSLTKEQLDPKVHVITASNKPGIATGHDASTSDIDITINQINPAVIDGLFLIGGPGALEALDTPQVHALLQEMMALNKYYGSICIASRILAKAGVLGKKRATGWDGDHKLSGIFDEHAVIYTREPVTIDRTVVTATDPSAAQQFGKAILKVLGL